MSDNTSHNEIGLILLAGIGAGVITGIAIGLLATGRRRGSSVDEISETVDDLKRRAEQILQELSQTQSISDSQKLF